MIRRSFFGVDATLHHIGLAVSSIREVCPDCEVVSEQTQKVHLAFVSVGGVTLELLEPLDADSPVAQSLRQGIKLLHLCYEVPDLEAAVECCRADGFHRISKPIPTTALNNRRIVWVFSKHYGLVELLEREVRV